MLECPGCNNPYIPDPNNPPSRCMNCGVTYCPSCSDVLMTTCDIKQLRETGPVVTTVRTQDGWRTDYSEKNGHIYSTFEITRRLHIPVKTNLVCEFCLGGVDPIYESVGEIFRASGQAKTPEDFFFHYLLPSAYTRLYSLGRVHEPDPRIADSMKPRRTVNRYGMSRDTKDPTVPGWSKIRKHYSELAKGHLDYDLVEWEAAFRGFKPDDPRTPLIEELRSLDPSTIDMRRERLGHTEEWTESMHEAVEYESWGQEVFDLATQAFVIWGESYGDYLDRSYANWREARLFIMMAYRVLYLEQPDAIAFVERGEDYLDMVQATREPVTILDSASYVGSVRLLGPEQNLLLKEEIEEWLFDDQEEYEDAIGLLIDQEE